MHALARLLLLLLLIGALSLFGQAVLGLVPVLSASVALSFQLLLDADGDADVDAAFMVGYRSLGCYITASSSA